MKRRSLDVAAVSATITSAKLEGARNVATGRGGAPRLAAVEMGAVVAAETSVATTEGAETSRAHLSRRLVGHLTHLPAYGCR